MNYRFVKSQLQSLFSGKNVSEKTVKIIKNKVKNIKSRVILNFFHGIFFTSFCCCQLINMHNYNEQQANRCRRC